MTKWEYANSKVLHKSDMLSSNMEMGVEASYYQLFGEPLPQAGQNVWIKRARWQPQRLFETWTLELTDKAANKLKCE